MSFRCPSVGCDFVAQTKHAVRSHWGRWCKLKESNAKNIFNKRTREVESEQQAKRARLEADAQARARQGQVSLFTHLSYTSTHRDFSTGTPWP